LTRLLEDKLNQLFQKLRTPIKIIFHATVWTVWDSSPNRSR